MCVAVCVSLSSVIILKPTDATNLSCKKDNFSLFLTCLNFLGLQNFINVLFFSLCIFYSLEPCTV